ncbi:hypothetical protein [Geodermatophilus marinus]|uniref:hypothetical protein n=1 Tax=Geodermatophilus sp. LHW52908 TaxID=2303986 RepID=UPI000E3E1E84|nr:hypothetical protein [Geodermatophilus sp. LHW52908]RFU23101.1 hypothetical protein D0Z06_00050 [Geodermatophilus sp. LHW52908]
MGRKSLVRGPPGTRPDGHAAPARAVRAALGRVSTDRAARTAATARLALDAVALAVPVLGARDQAGPRP